MTKRMRFTLIGLGAVAVLAIAAGVGIANVGDDDQPLQGSAEGRAIAAALAETGGGEVIETELGDDGAAYSVEVRLADGTVLEVDLDEGFRVIGSETDDDGAETQDDDAGETEQE
jgi:uncharacterized membrane protein YkoI